MPKGSEREYEVIASFTVTTTAKDEKEAIKKAQTVFDAVLRKNITKVGTVTVRRLR